MSQQAANTTKRPSNQPVDQASKHCLPNTTLHAAHITDSTTTLLGMVPDGSTTDDEMSGVCMLASTRKYYRLSKKELLNFTSPSNVFTGRELLSNG